MERKPEAAHRDGNHPDKAGRGLGLEMRGAGTGLRTWRHQRGLKCQQQGLQKRFSKRQKQKFQGTT